MTRYDTLIATVDDERAFHEGRFDDGHGTPSTGFWEGGDKSGVYTDGQRSPSNIIIASSLLHSNY